MKAISIAKWVVFFIILSIHEMSFSREIVEVIPFRQSQNVKITVRLLDAVGDDYAEVKIGNTSKYLTTDNPEENIFKGKLHHSSFTINISDSATLVIIYTHCLKKSTRFIYPTFLKKFKLVINNGIVESITEVQDVLSTYNPPIYYIAPKNVGTKNICFNILDSRNLTAIAIWMRMLKYSYYPYDIVVNCTNANLNVTYENNLGQQGGYYIEPDTVKIDLDYIGYPLLLMHEFGHFMKFNDTNMSGNKRYLYETNNQLIQDLMNPGLHLFKDNFYEYQFSAIDITTLTHPTQI